MAKVKLTKRAIDSLPIAGNRSGESHYDTELPGFGVIVYPSGKKTFFVRYGPRDHRRRFMLGQYGVLTPETARVKAREVLGQLAGGGDPIEDRDKIRGSLTFSQWVASYLPGVERRKKDGARKDKAFLKMAEERWADRHLTDITVEDVRKLFDHLSVEGGRKGTGVRIHANRWLASVRACLQAAWREDKIPNNPAMKVRPNPENAPRARVLNDKEFEKLLKHVDQLPDPYVRAGFVLLIETGARLSEVLRAEWEHFDLQQGVWRMPRTKSGHVQVLPLAPATVATLATLPRPGKYVVAGRDPDKPRRDLKRAWLMLQANLKLKDVHIHDLRRTFGLHIARRAGLHVASKLLRHSDIRVTERVYAPLGIDDLRKALDTREADIVEFKGRNRADG